MTNQIRSALGSLAVAGALAVVGFAWSDLWFWAGLIAVIALGQIAWSLLKPQPSA